MILHHPEQVLARSQPYETVPLGTILSPSEDGRKPQGENHKALAVKDERHPTWRQSQTQAAARTGTRTIAVRGERVTTALPSHNAFVLIISKYGLVPNPPFNSNLSEKSAFFNFLKKFCQFNIGLSDSYNKLHDPQKRNSQLSVDLFQFCPWKAHNRSLYRRSGRYNL